MSVQINPDFSPCTPFPIPAAISPRNGKCQGVQTALGLAIGIPTAYFCVRYIEAQLYEIKGVNPAILLVAVGTLIVAAALAGFIPARRAASIDPARALRIE